MIDWVTATLPIKHLVISDGMFMDVGECGSLLRQSLKRKKVPGSHESTVQIKTQRLDDNGEYGAELFFDGNPSKFLQGHNVAGSDDICALMVAAVERVFAFLGQPLDDLSLSRIRNGAFRVHRVDINYAFSLPSYADVMAWLQAASVKSRTRHGKPELVKSTLYWGKGSTLWMLKGYSKFHELTTGSKRSHRLPRELLQTPLLDYARNKLRIELQLRKELRKISRTKHNQSHFYAWMMNHPDTSPTTLFNEFLGRIEMNANIPLKDQTLCNLPRKLRLTYDYWARGGDPRDMVSAATYYRHRSDLIEVAGVDIACPAPDTESTTSNVVPLIRPLTAKPAAIPDNVKQYCFGA